MFHILMTLAGLRLDQLGGCSKNLTGYKHPQVTD